ncbi:hypothetical protein KO502_06470 [Colwellia sp. E2M01]|nr:hypothetical protein [Colwellia sp. E2M01]
MKSLLKLLFILNVFHVQPSYAWFFSVNSDSAVSSEQEASAANNKIHNDWLKQRFSEQHQALIPIVAVADMFFACNNARKSDNATYALDFLITEMDRDTLAEKLSNCLGDDTMQSDIALNFGLFGCFHGQLAHLPPADRDEKMRLVTQAVSALSQEERKKSFTQCVTEQAIHYLQ